MKVAVIGGGIVGATTGYYLTKRNDQVTIYDDKIGQATSAAAGIISPWLSQRRNQNWYQLALTGAKFYPQLITDLGIPNESDIYQQVGTILFKKNESLLNKLYEIALERRIEAPEIGEVSLLTPQEIQAKIPILNPEMSGLFVTGGARVDGRELIKRLISQFTLNGGSFKAEKVIKIKKDDKQWQIETATSTETYDKIVLATGAWLPQLIEPLGYQVDVRGQKGQLVQVSIKTDTTNWPVIMPQGESDIIPFDNGQILVGATHENEQEYDLTIDQEMITELLESIKELAPSLTKAPIIETRVGTRAYTADFLPFFGEVETLAGLYVASGLGSSGLTTGPIIGHSLAKAIHGEKTEIELINYVPDHYVRKNDI